MQNCVKAPSFNLSAQVMNWEEHEYKADTGGQAAGQPGAGQCSVQGGIKVL